MSSQGFRIWLARASPPQFQPGNRSTFRLGTPHQYQPWIGALLRSGAWGGRTCSWSSRCKSFWALHWPENGWCNCGPQSLEAFSNISVWWRSPSQLPLLAPGGCGHSTPKTRFSSWIDLRRRAATKQHSFAVWFFHLWPFQRWDVQESGRGIFSTKPPKCHLLGSHLVSPAQQGCAYSCSLEENSSSL